MRRDSATEIMNICETETLIITTQRYPLIRNRCLDTCVRFENDSVNVDREAIYSYSCCMPVMFVYMILDRSDPGEECE